MGKPLHRVRPGPPDCRRHGRISGVRAEALRQADFSATQATGYAFQIELAYRVFRNSGKVVEIPIVFTDRVSGESKMSLQDRRGSNHHRDVVGPPRSGLPTRLGKGHEGGYANIPMNSKMSESGVARITPSRPSPRALPTSPHTASRWLIENVTNHTV